ncbi:MAG: DUF996 domain-containing protein [Acidilobaceae archaeon]
MKVQVGPIEMDFARARLFGMAGVAIFLLSFLIPFIGILGIVGLILLLLSLYYFSKYYSNPPIFWNYVYSLAIGLVATITLSLIFFVLFRLLYALVPPAGTVPPDLSDPVALQQFGMAMLAAGILHFVLFIIFALVAGLLFLVSFFFYYRSMSALSASSGVGFFRLAGLSALGGMALFVIGAVLAIVLIGILFIFLGGLAILISYILLLVAFYMLKEPAPAPQPPAQQPAVPA